MLSEFICTSSESRGCGSSHTAACRLLKASSKAEERALRRSIFLCSSSASARASLREMNNVPYFAKFDVPAAFSSGQRTYVLHLDRTCRTMWANHLPSGQIAAQPLFKQVSHGTYRTRRLVHMHSHCAKPHLSVTPKFQPVRAQRPPAQDPDDDPSQVTTYRRHSAQETGTRPGLRLCLGSAEPEPKLEEIALSFSAGAIVVCTV